MRGTYKGKLSEALTSQGFIWKRRMRLQGLSEVLLKNSFCTLVGRSHEIRIFHWLYLHFIAARTCAETPGELLCSVGSAFAITEKKL